MADAAVSFFLDNVSQLLARETGLIGGVQDQILSLHYELNLMNQFLKNSVGNREKVKEVVNQIQEVAQEAEDVIDTFVINVENHKRRSTLRKYWHGWKHNAMLRGVATDIEDIKKKIKEIHENKDKYDIIENINGAAAGEELERISIQRRRRDVEEDEVVSFGKDAEAVIEKLNEWNLRRDVVSIIGMGGLGKTTLAKKIYKDNFVKNQFDCHAWVNVSQDYSIKELLLKIVEALMLPTSEEPFKLTEEKLMQKLNKHLMGKKYLIVLDDVWDTDLWDAVKAAFPDNLLRSRVLITSRVKEVASRASRTPPYFLPLLNEVESWELFSKKVFLCEDGQVWTPQLEELGRQIVEKCNGLPLAIMLVAGLLVNREESMWSKVASGLSWYLTQDPIKCLGILALSYEDLPPKLKPCFQYFGGFPEDFDIPVRLLIRLWIAEGLVDQENRNNLEDVAEEYLYQLIDRSLIQVATRRADGGIKSCRIHDLLRDLSITKGIQEKFMEVHKIIDAPFATKPRRVSIHFGNSDLRYDYLSASDFSRARTLLYFGEPDYRYNLLDKDPFCRLSKFCTFLRVLDLGSERLHKFPPGVEKLVHLRYLRMSTKFLQHLPSTISKLSSLQTLDLRHSDVSRITANLWEMQQLRHLFLSRTKPFFFSFPKANNIVRTMPNIRTLSEMCCYDKDAMDCLLMARFPNLTKLRLYARDKFFAIFKCLRNLQHLQTLRIRYQFCLTNPSALPWSLTKITLVETQLDSSSFVKLGDVPNLKILKLLDKSLEGRSFCINEGGFPRLQVLHMVKLDIEQWFLEVGGLQTLQHLFIFKCNNLIAIPDQLKQISTLCHLKMRWCKSLSKKAHHRVWGNDKRCEFEDCKYDA